MYESDLFDDDDDDEMFIHGRRVTRSPQAGAAMSAIQTVAEAMRAGKDISKAGGWIKDFVYAVTAPIYKSLNRDHNVHAIKRLH